MGFLHEGHLSLVRKSKEVSDITIVSIFVNPAQFSPAEDLSSYPRDIDRDKNLLKLEGVDYIFNPSAEEIYPENFQTFVEVDKISKPLEGEFRPVHFKGVTTVVAILFNCVSPDYAFFGQKDAQQISVIKQMVSDLKFDVEIFVCPIIRESDGLAMSSRNIYLTKDEREKSLLLSKSLFQAEELIKNGERDSQKVIKKISNIFLSEKNVHLNYLKIVDSAALKESGFLESGKDYYILIAARIGKTRLIDNVMIKL